MNLVYSRTIKCRSAAACDGVAAAPPVVVSPSAAAAAARASHTARVQSLELVEFLLCEGDEAIVDDLKAEQWQIGEFFAHHSSALQRNHHTIPFA